ncbi:MAG: tRNA (adenosine(37)-N6)-dimethylallyltransferase MiaA [Acidimicrobiia bacterium]
MLSSKHLALIGPTASGKSALALQLARACGDLEIVAVDSMQIYRGLDIGTAKPTPAERAEIPHHGLDLTDPSATYSVAEFQRYVRTAITDIEARNNRALLVAGTGLYLQAVIDDLQFPGEDLTVRAELEAATNEPGGLARAYAELVALDPLGASRIDEHNQRRIVRALEVIRITGRPFSSFGPGITGYGPPAFPVRMMGLWLPRAALATRIDARVQLMRERGFLDEVRALAATPLSRTARQAIGYAELLAYLAGEQPDLDEAFALTVRRTRSYARRQRMWFRRDPRITWFGTAEDPARCYPDLLAWAQPIGV